MMLLACGRPLAGSWRTAEALRRVSMAEKSEFRDRDAFSVVSALKIKERELSGSSYWTRTSDIRINSPPFYRLN